MQRLGTSHGRTEQLFKHIENRLVVTEIEHQDLLIHEHVRHNWDIMKINGLIAAGTSHGQRCASGTELDTRLGRIIHLDLSLFWDVLSAEA
jgi:hypothetical protein